MPKRPKVDLNKLYSDKPQRTPGGYFLPGVHLTVHGGKLAGLISISTSTVANEFCQKMARNNKAVCSHCYAARTERYRGDSLTMALRRNDFALCHTVLSDIGKGKLPAHIRFNSFGELIDSTHAQNVCKIAETFPATQFTLWTKRPDLLFYAGTLPNNLSVIYSYPLVNPSEGDLNTIQCNAARHWPFISAIYAVYDKDSGVPPCGTKCLDCLKCYPPVKLPDGRPSIIKQRLH